MAQGVGPEFKPQYHQKKKKKKKKEKSECTWWLTSKTPATWEA
jgi:hypothetical protein